MKERVIAFGTSGRLVGTLCLPDAPSAGGSGVGQILYNAGIVHRVGPHRINVRLARRLASRGIASLRFDLSGLGDSQRAPDTASFDDQAVRDLGEAMEALGRETGLHRFTLFGFCSGGRHAYATAPQDPRVAGVVIYDTYAFPTTRSRLIRYRLRAQRDGLANAVLGRLRRMLRAMTAGPSGPARSSDGGFVVNPPKAEFAARIGALVERGTKVGIVHSGEGDNFNYGDQFRDAFRGSGIEAAVTFDYFPAMDHTVLDLAAQVAFIDRLVAWTVELDDRCRKAEPAP